MHQITAEMLAGKSACRKELELFRQEWPNGFEVTLENCQRAAAIGLDLNWAAKKFLSAPALKAYEEARATALWNAWLMDQQQVEE